MKLNSKQKRVFASIHEDPVRSDIIWKDIEKLVIALGGKMSKGKGSRVRFKLKNVRAVFHRPHPEPITDKGTVKSIKKFLETAGVNIDEL